MTFTGANIIERTLRDIKVVGVGRSLVDRDASFALTYLQELVDSWQLRRLSMYQVTRSPFTLVVSTQTRTIGPSGQFVLTPKPTFIASATVLPVGETMEQPVDVWTHDRWLGELNKAQTDLYPRALQMETGPTNNTLNFWPIPTTAATLYLGIPTGIVGFADLTTSYTFPPGYHRLFRTELALLLAGPFGQAVTPKMEKDARDAREELMSYNSDGPPELPRGPFTSGAYYDGYSDSFFKK